MSPMSGETWRTSPVFCQGVPPIVLALICAGNAQPTWEVEKSGSSGVRSLQNRTYLYSLERRWVDAPFWARRQERARKV